ncbi:MAG: hypothetical protein HY841_14815, partial [Bacteroidetes bacterium]|nr:hypothetical protein [Bacteroidota bacterium]
AITHRATLNDELVTLFKEANEILNKTLDPISVSFKTNGNKHYLSDYQKAREIIDLGKGTTRIKGKITMLSADGEPAYNKTVKINEQNVEVKTDVEGLFVHEPEAPATVTMTDQADKWNLTNGQFVKVFIDGQRSLTFNKVGVKIVVKINPSFNGRLSSGDCLSIFLRLLFLRGQLLRSNFSRVTVPR